MRCPGDTGRRRRTTANCPEMVRSDGPGWHAPRGIGTHGRARHRSVPVAVRHRGCSCLLRPVLTVPSTDTGRPRGRAAGGPSEGPDVVAGSRARSDRPSGRRTAEHEVPRRMCTSARGRSHADRGGKPSGPAVRWGRFRPPDPGGPIPPRMFERVPRLHQCQDRRAARDVVGGSTGPRGWSG